MPYVPSFTIESGRGNEAAAIIDLVRQINDTTITPKIASIAAQWYGHRTCYGASGALTTGALTANQHLAVPFFVQGSLSADRIGLNVTTAGAAGKLLRLGIYDANAAGLPGALLVDSGAIAADTAAPFIAIATIAYTLVPGPLYYLTVLTDGTPTVSVVTPVAAPYGFTATGTAIDGASRPVVVRTETYAALPVAFGTTGLTFGTTIPHTCVRAA